jgi:hypothetical protein
MRTRDQAAVEFKLDVAVGRGRLVVLRDLVILRHVRIEITFPVELGEAGNLAIQQETGEHRQAQRLVVGHGQHAGQAEADGADVGVGRRAECIGATAPHLRFRFELDVRFQPDDRFVFHNFNAKAQRRKDAGGMFLAPRMIDTAAQSRYLAL